MLVLSRKVDERIRIGDDIVITICRLENNRVSVGIDAPLAYQISREDADVDRRREVELQRR